MTVVKRLKAIPKPVFFILAFCLIIPLVIFVLGSQQFELICEFSGGAGETTTESFHLERQGNIRLTNWGYVLIFPSIEVYRVGENQPLGAIYSEHDAMGLAPSDYYIVVEAGWGSSWTIVVEEAVSGR